MNCTRCGRAIRPGYDLCHRCVREVRDFRKRISPTCSIHHHRSVRSLRKAYGASEWDDRGR